MKFIYIYKKKREKRRKVIYFEKKWKYKGINYFFQSLTYIEKNGWVEQFEAPLFSKDGTSFLLILPRKQKDGTDWRHLVLVKNATSIDPITVSLTSGYFVVTEIVAWDQENSYV